MSEEERQKIMMECVPANWDNKPLVLASEIRQFLKTIADEGTGIDSGGCDGCADLWVKVGGVEYYVTIRKSNNQLAKEGLTHE